MLTIAVTAFLLALCGQPVAIFCLRRWSVLDRPTARSSHRIPTPRGGGIAVIFALVVSGCLAGVAGPTRLVLLAVLLSAGVGLIEDLRGIPVLRRLSLQFLAVTPLVFATSGQARLPVALWAAFSVVYLVSVMNAVNFMDGINGITSAQGMVAGVAFAILATRYHQPDLAVFAASTAAVCLAFLPFNAPRARVFLGDSGSYGLGAAMGALSLSVWAAGVPWEGSVAPLAIYLADTGTTLVRRIRAGEAIGLPHRTHVYQRLTDVGWSHTRVSAYVLVCAACCSVLGAVSLRGGATRLGADIGLALVVVGYLASPLLARTLPHPTTLRLQAAR